MIEVDEEVDDARNENEIYAGTRWATTCFTMPIKAAVCSDQWILRFELSTYLTKMLFTNKIND